MVDEIEPIPFLVALSVLVAVWLLIGVRHRIVDRRIVRRGQVATARAFRAFSHGRCGRCFWVEEDRDYGVCQRPYEHTGPHVDAYTGQVSRGR